jgi:predicted nucleic acid-binding protein
MLVIADTSPLNYLILIDAVELLPRLYLRVVLPEAVSVELKHPYAPPAVSKWANALPPWIEIQQAPNAAHSEPSLAALGSGEREAIALAELYRSQTEVLLLLDEEAARKQAAARQLATTGTLGVLKSAAEFGWINLPQAFAHLRLTNFRVSEELLQKVIHGHAQRKKSTSEGQERG